MRKLTRYWIYRAFQGHCVGLHNADFEVCSHPLCWLAWQVERLLMGWLYGEEMWDDFT